MLKLIFHRTRRAAADLWLNTIHASVRQIAITGSYGKTSTTSAIFAVLSRHTPTLMTDLNLDTIYNVPITALQLRSNHRVAVFELGIDRPNEMDFHLQIIQPEISVITGISPVHSDDAHLGSLEAIIQQKGRIIEVLKPDNVAILNHTDAEVRKMAARTKASVFFYGTAEECDYRIENLKLTLKGTHFNLRTPSGVIEVSTPLLGEHNAINLAASAAVAQQIGIPDTLIQEVFAGLEPLQGRFNVEEGPNGLTLLNDSLRANPASTKAGLEFLRAVTVEHPKIAVLGEMGELGDHAITEHSDVGRAAAKSNPDILITVGDLTQHTAAAARESGMPTDRIFAVNNVHEAAKVLKDTGQPGTIIYLKGSLMRHMERIPMILEGIDVGCTVISCPFYHQCPTCEFLKSGYNPSHEG
jgi:UDP-N-acetylmuramoyl-tripeptide--D-alanyl-D-alanine ligase